MNALNHSENKDNNVEKVVSIEAADIYQGNKHLILENINFEVKKGEFIYLVGRTGQGKSSLLRTLYGDLELKKGEGKVCGYNLKPLKSKEVPYLRRKLGIIFQDFQLLQDKTVYDNLKFVLEAVEIKNPSIIKQKIEDALDKVKLPFKLDKYPSQLSGGEQQRVAIARALLNNPDLILADEPTGNLDPETTQEIMTLFYSIFNELKTPVVMATHEYNLIEQFPGIIYMCAYNQMTKDESHFIKR
jgi:cell division transport system ATP-binding protein